jgi:SPP1 family predicted phage head-tail adaptor
MIAAGMLNKHIVVEHLTIVRDEYGSDIETWKPVHVCRAQVKGSDSQSLTTVNDEVLMQNRILFSIRKFPVMDIANHYRIIYNRKVYNILNLNDEDRDTITILGIVMSEVLKS